MAKLEVLTKIEKERNLKEAFEKFLKRKGLTRYYKIANEAYDGKHAYQNFFDDLKPEERNIGLKLFFAVEKQSKRLYNAELKRLKDKEEENEDFWRKPRQEQKKVIQEKVENDKAWDRFLKDAKLYMRARLNHLAEKEFKGSDEYENFLRRNINARKIANDLELQADKEKIIGLAVAVGTGNEPLARRFSQDLAKSHRPKRGKAHQAKDLPGVFRKRLDKVCLG